MDWGELPKIKHQQHAQERVQTTPNLFSEDWIHLHESYITLFKSFEQHNLELTT